jgi:hypothetical protein
VPRQGSDNPNATPSEQTARSKAVRGWIYVITNEAMPHLVKVGFSTKDPHQRAKELGGTGIPHPYRVAYDLLVYAPRDLEKRVHQKLADMREGKEWFRCSVAHAIEAIKSVDPGTVPVQSERHVKASPDPNNPPAKHPPVRQPAISAGTPLSDTHATLPRIREAGTYRGHCTYCGENFSATLTRDDTMTRCPTCLRLQDTSGFRKAEVIL